MLHQLYVLPEFSEVSKMKPYIPVPLMTVERSFTEYFAGACHDKLTLVAPGHWPYAGLELGLALDQPAAAMAVARMLGIMSGKRIIADKVV